MRADGSAVATRQGAACQITGWRTEARVACRSQRTAPSGKATEDHPLLLEHLLSKLSTLAAADRETAAHPRMEERRRR